jgi:hypothetical protein
VGSRPGKRPPSGDAIQSSKRKLPAGKRHPAPRGGLDPAVRERFASDAEFIRLAMGTAIERMAAAGERLAFVKEGLPHGQWLPWIRTEFRRRSDQWARNAMNFARRVAKFKTVLNLVELNMTARAAIVLTGKGVPPAAFELGVSLSRREKVDEPRARGIVGGFSIMNNLAAPEGSTSLANIPSSVPAKDAVLPTLDLHKKERDPPLDSVDMSKLPRRPQSALRPGGQEQKRAGDPGDNGANSPHQPSASNDGQRPATESPTADDGQKPPAKPPKTRRGQRTKPAPAGGEQTSKDSQWTKAEVGTPEYCRDLVRHLVDVGQRTPVPQVALAERKLLGHCIAVLQWRRDKVDAQIPREADLQPPAPQVPPPGGHKKTQQESSATHAPDSRQTLPPIEGWSDFDAELERIVAALPRLDAAELRRDPRLKLSIRQNLDHLGGGFKQLCEEIDAPNRSAESDGKVEGGVEARASSSRVPGDGMQRGAEGRSRARGGSK